jgi:hypothetical protein
MLTPEQDHALTLLLDELIPPSEDGRLPGAGALGLAEGLREHALTPSIAQGLERLDALAGEQGAASFAAAGNREALLRALDTESPGALGGLLFHTYTTYYQHPQVLEGLGVDPRPPHPKGYEIEAGDLSSLAAIRQRGPLYREA